MKKYVILFCFFLFSAGLHSQEFLADVTVNTQLVTGSNQQNYKTLERSLRDFINNTSWTGKQLENFEKIKSNFSIVINKREGNRYEASIVVQAVRPVYGTTYESPLLNLNDVNFTFEYVENENLIFNERQFSGKNLIDVVSFYIYLIAGYDADTYKVNGGQQWFTKAQQISQNAQNRGFSGWAQIEGPRNRGSLIAGIMNPNFSAMRNIYYVYHRNGLDLLSQQDPSLAKKNIADALQKLRTYESNFQQNYAINIFLDVKADEIFNIFDSTNNGPVNINDLKQLMNVFSPKNTDSKWSKWK